MSIFPIFQLYAENIRQVQFVVFLKPALISLVVAIVVYFLIRRRGLSPEKSGILLAAAFFLFFSHGYLLRSFGYPVVDWVIPHIGDTEREKFLHYSVLALHGCLLTLETGILVLLSRRIHGSSKDFRKLTIFLNVLLCVLIGMYAVIAVLGFRDRSADSFQKESPEPIDSSEAPDSENFPDIYFIILDGYTRADMLQKYYRYDDSGFLNYLGDLGFYVAGESISNYSETILSLASTLNMNYLAGTVSSLGKKKRDDRLYFDMIRDNQVTRFLRSKGYRFVHFGSTSVYTLSNPLADTEIIYRRGIFRSEFYRVLFETSMLGVFDFILTEDVAKTHLYNFDQLARMPEARSPKFVFAHFVLPHSPYVFDRDGNVKSHIRREHIWDPENNVWNDAAGYRDQLIFTSKAVVKSVTEILQNSKKPPIIVLQADHGINLVMDQRKGRHIRHAILNAIYFPDGNYQGLYPGISSVNTFRVIFNKVFGAGLERLPDKRYYTSG